MAEKTRLVIDSMALAQPRPSGISHYVYNLLKALLDSPEVKSRYEVSLVITNGGLPYLKKYGLKGAKERTIPLPTRVFNRLPMLPLPPMDLLFGHGVYLFPNYFNWPLTDASRSITYIHDVSYMRYPEVFTPRHRQHLLTQIPKSITRTDLVATLSQSAKSEIQKFLHVDPSKIIVAYPSVDQTVFFPRPIEEIAAVQKTYGLPREYILFVGNIEPRKNLSRLIEAYTSLDKDLSRKYTLVLIGADGWLQSEINSQIKTATDSGLKIIRPSRYIPDKDLPAIYSGAALFVFPSLYEGFGMPPLEAMACGVPSILSQTSSLPEAGGQAALYVDPLSVADIAAKIEQVLKDSSLQKQMKERGLTHAGSFSWQESADVLLQSIDDLAKTLKQKATS